MNKEIHNEAEQGLIGGLFQNNAAILDINLKEEDFFQPWHGKAFTTMQEIFNSRGAFTLADFQEWRFYEFPKDMGYDDPYDYLREIAGTYVFGMTHQLIHYADLIKENKNKKTLLDLIGDIKNNLWNMPYRDLLATLQNDLQEDQIDDDLLTEEDVHQRVLQRLELPPACSKTGLPSLDMAMAGGLYQGFTYGFCGAEKSGKTTLAHTISYNLNQLGTKHLYIALEMGAEQIHERNVARDIGKNSLVFLNESRAIGAKAAAHKPKNNIIYSNKPGANLQEVLNVIAKAKARYGIEGFILDYWQLVTGKKNGESEESFTRNVAQSVANFARKHKLWCVMLAQMNQDGKLFGGNGLRKACDQLYMIQESEFDEETRWLKMDASRYTIRGDVGSNTQPAFEMNKRVGPYFMDLM